MTDTELAVKAVVAVSDGATEAVFLRIPKTEYWSRLLREAGGSRNLNDYVIDFPNIPGVWVYDPLQEREWRLAGPLDLTWMYEQ